MQAWDGVTLLSDDPWWKTHAVPNGWGCKCYITGATRSEYEAAKKAGNGTAPESPIDPKTGEPKGIDKGWGYNVGEAAFGKSWVQESGKFEELGPWRAAQYPGLPQKLAGAFPPVGLAPRVQGDEHALRAAIPEGIYQDKLGDYVNVTSALADHILENPDTRWDGRERYFPLIPDIIENPQEIWVGFIRYTDSGRVYLRKRYIKAYVLGKGRIIGVLADTAKEQTVAFAVFRTEKMKGARLRSGRLVYAETE